MKLDLHCHSRYSRDAVTSPEHIAEIAKQNGLVVALTDHNNTAGWRHYAGACKRLGIDFIFGQEQKVYWQNSIAGELLFLFLQEEIKSRQVFEAIDEARAQDAFISVSHPFVLLRGMQGGGFRKIERLFGKVDAIEVFNARCYSLAPNNAAKRFAEKNSLGFTAGSDAHFPKEIGNAFLELEAASLEEARKLLAKGKARIHGRLASPIVHFETQLAKFGFLKKENC